MSATAQVKQKDADCFAEVRCTFLAMQDAYDYVSKGISLRDSNNNLFPSEKQDEFGIFSEFRQPAPLLAKERAELVSFFHDVGKMFPELLYPVETDGCVNYHCYDPIHAMPFMQGPGLPRN